MKYLSVIQGEGILFNREASDMIGEGKFNIFIIPEKGIVKLTRARNEQYNASYLAYQGNTNNLRFRNAIYKHLKKGRYILKYYTMRKHTYVFQKEDR